MKRGVVFDMDKCIGYFTQIARYQDIIEELTRPLKVNEYIDLFNMFPEIFRPGIFNVFRYLAKEKKKGRLKVIIYTNNNGPPSWAANIRKYIEHKIKKKLFDRTIKGWKYDKKIVEKNRSGYAKTWKDLMDCSQLNKHDKIIFFDDRDEHDGMRHKNVDYQEVKPYKTDITHEVFVKRFMRSKLKNKLGYIEESVLKNMCERSGHKPKMTSMKYSNNDIMKPLREFLKKNKNKTRRRRGIKNKKTRKKRRKRNRTRKKMGGVYSCGDDADPPAIPWAGIDTNKNYWIKSCPGSNIQMDGKYRVNSKYEDILDAPGYMDVLMMPNRDQGLAVLKSNVIGNHIKFFGPLDGGEEKQGEWEHGNDSDGTDILTDNEEEEQVV